MNTNSPPWPEPGGPDISPDQLLELMDEGERLTLPELREKLRRNGDCYNHGSVEPALRALCESGSVMHTRKQAGDTFTKPRPT